MAQPDDTRRTTTTDTLNIPRPQNSPGSKSSSTQTSPHGQNWQGGSSSRSSNSSPKPRKSHDHDDHGNHHNKKSVFTKVKEKARKLKKSLSGRRRREENDFHTSTPPRSSGPVEDDDNDHSEYYGSPLYEPTVDKQLTKEQAEESEGSSEKPNMSKNGAPSLCSTDAKLSDLTISTRENTETANPNAKTSESSLEEKENMRSSPQSQSVKEYLMHKFEPGDDERALSQKITQTISPRYERMKDTMHSFLRSEEPSESTSKTSNAADITPSSSSMESSSLSNHPNLSNTLESNLSDASNTSQCSASTTSPVSSNLKPDSGVKDDNCQRVLHS